jgi:hypothetical protein
MPFPHCTGSTLDFLHAQYPLPPLSLVHLSAGLGRVGKEWMYGDFVSTCKRVKQWALWVKRVRSVKVVVVRGQEQRTTQADSQVPRLGEQHSGATDDDEKEKEEFKLACLPPSFIIDRHLAEISGRTFFLFRIRQDARCSAAPPSGSTAAATPPSGHAHRGTASAVAAPL